MDWIKQHKGILALIAIVWLIWKAPEVASSFVNDGFGNLGDFGSSLETFVKGLGK